MTAFDDLMQATQMEALQQHHGRSVTLYPENGPAVTRVMVVEFEQQAPADYADGEAMMRRATGWLAYDADSGLIAIDDGLRVDINGERWQVERLVGPVGGQWELHLVRTVSVTKSMQGWGMKR